jgi:hypothetical protein
VQLPPPRGGDWSIYLACCGRGWGKTRAGAEWIAEQAATQPGTEWAVIAPTFREVRKTCIEGRSGLLNAFLPGELEGYNASNAQLRLANGSRIWGYSADKPDRLRGSNLSGAWIDELCSMVHAQQLWAEALTPALRIGDRPRVFITTPRPVPLLRELLARDDGSVLTVHGSTWNNEANLSKTALEEMRIRHQGTRLGRQELLGELIEDVEGALWTREHSKTPGSPSRPSSSPASSSGSTRPSPAARTPTRRVVSDSSTSPGLPHTPVGRFRVRSSLAVSCRKATGCCKAWCITAWPKHHRPRSSNGPPPTEEQVVEAEQDQRSEQPKPPRPEVEEADNVFVKERPGDEATQKRTRDANQDGDDEPTGILARHDQFRERADDQPEHDPTQDPNPHDQPPHVRISPTTGKNLSATWLPHDHNVRTAGHRMHDKSLSKAQQLTSQQPTPHGAGIPLHSPQNASRYKTARAPAPAARFLPGSPW